MAVQSGMTSQFDFDFEQEPYSYGAEQALSEQERSFEELEAAVKETPPRPIYGHGRTNSEPRAIGDVIDESERLLPPGSPGLRHTKGRLESNTRLSPNTSESFADVVKHEPANPTTPSNPFSERATKKKSPSLSEGFPRIVKDGDPITPLTPTMPSKKAKHSKSKDQPNIPHADGGSEQPTTSTGTTESYAEVVKHEPSAETDRTLSHAPPQHLQQEETVDHSFKKEDARKLESLAQDTKQQVEEHKHTAAQNTKQRDVKQEHTAAQNTRQRDVKQEHTVAQDIKQQVVKQEHTAILSGKQTDGARQTTSSRAVSEQEADRKENTQQETHQAGSDLANGHGSVQSKKQNNSRPDKHTQNPEVSTSTTNGTNYAEVVKREPTSPSLPSQDSAELHKKPSHNGIKQEEEEDFADTATAIAEEDAAPTLEGSGKDSSARSPHRRAHKKASSRSLDNSANRALQQALRETETLPKKTTEARDPEEQKEQQTNNAQNAEAEDHKEQQTNNAQNAEAEEQKEHQTNSEQNAEAEDQKEHQTSNEQNAEAEEPGTLVYENYNSRSGTNLASVILDSEFELAAEQQKNKDITSSETNVTKSRDSKLVSGRRAGAGWARSAIRWAPLNVPLQRRLQTLAVLMHSLSIGGMLAIFFALCAIPIFWPILLPYLLYVLLSRAPSDGTLALRKEWIRRSKFWSLFASYFPARLHRTVELEPTRKYIFGYHPHGIISHGAFAAFTTEALGFGQLFPGITNTLLTLDSNFRIPLYRDWALRLGLASVSRESCENLLSKGGPNGEGMGRAITIVIGGARESLDAKPGTLNLVLARRKGFVKLAVRTGADLVPVLAFGENDMYDQISSDTHPWIHKVQMMVKKFMGFTVPLFHARGIFNYDVGIMPYRRPVNIVVGRPIKTIQSRKPDSEYVDQLHKQYTDELLHMWEEWKDVFAPQRNCELAIIE
ncbi:hypothetical protein AMS68_002310 [Peltaster fructicola]|uniref:diacylglycerol O-acyltransferase n=1 Tax=Peltaster fructicola TaxID=286661 RepID=A0A6H0XQ08_9PEZI|nr:hypothetical protein AMS68_002310 [Peltaster fructicola]